MIAAARDRDEAGALPMARLPAERAGAAGSPAGPTRAAL